MTNSEAAWLAMGRLKNAAALYARSLDKNSRLNVSTALQELLHAARHYTAAHHELTRHTKTGDSPVDPLPGQLELPHHKTNTQGVSPTHCIK